MAEGLVTGESQPTTTVITEVGLLKDLVKVLCKSPFNTSFCLFLFFEVGYHSVAGAGLRLTKSPSLALNSESFCSSLLRAGVSVLMSPWTLFTRH